MEKNKSSENNPQSTGKDVNENGNSGISNKGKGTGMSSEAGADQTEESWQGTGGSSVSEAQRKSMNEGSDNEIPKGSTNMSNSGMSNQSDDSDNEDVKKSDK